MPKELVILRNDRPVVTSLQVGETFNKEHKDVLEKIRENMNNLTAEFSAANFLETTYKNRGKEYPMYLMTKDGFTILAMGFTGETAMQFKEMYIKKFNDMERFITSKNLARTEFPALTDNIKLMHEEPKFYHYSNECNMINKIVLGMTAKEYKEANNIAEDANIRDCITSDQIYYIEKLQKADVGMVIAIPEFQDRKKALQNFYHMLKKERENKLMIE